MVDGFNAGPEFLGVSEQIGKNAAVLRKDGKLKYFFDKFPLNNSPILCEIWPRPLTKDVLCFNIHAHQHSERFIEPNPDLTLKKEVSSENDLEALLDGVDLNQLVLSAIETQRAAIHTSQQESQAQQIKVATAKSSPDKLGSYRSDAEELVAHCIERFPENSTPGEDEVNEEGLTLEMYGRLFSERNNVVAEIARELMDGEQRDAAAYLDHHAQQLELLDRMEAKAMQRQYTTKLRGALPGTLLMVDIKFQP